MLAFYSVVIYGWKATQAANVVTDNYLINATSVSDARTQALSKYQSNHMTFDTFRIAEIRGPMPDIMADGSDGKIP